MALLGHATDFPIRPSNKEQQAPDWSSICNNVFDQYLDTTDDLFAFDPDPRERSDSNDSGNLFDFSAGSGSEQSHQTDATSPLPAWQQQVSGAEVVIEAQQPKAQEPVDFWTKTLRALEQNAAQSEIRQQTLRTAKSHPDFLSLGGCPSPPAIPSSPTDQSLSVQRSRARNNAANGKRQASQHHPNHTRSVSRGRPTGIAKNPSTNRAVSTAAGRKASQSPSKMMTPSRYRAGFRDVWNERSGSTKKYELRLPVSPPPSSRDQEDESAAFGSPPPPPLAPACVPLPAVSTYDDQLSPLTTTFQHASLHTPPPIASSPRALNAAAHAVNGGYFADNAGSVPPNPYLSGQGLVSDTAPLFQGKEGLSGQSQGIQSFDFGFEDGQGPFSTAAALSQPVTATGYSTAVDSLAFQDPFSPLLDGTVLPSIEQINEMAPTGLGISCDPTLVSGLATMQSLGALHTTAGYQIPLNDTPYYLPHQPTHPTTPSHNPSRRSTSRLRSLSPSPTPVPASDSRSRQPSSRRHRSASRHHHHHHHHHHRRAKSLNATSSSSTTTSTSTPRQGGSSSNSSRETGGFVNYTPSDSTKILSGVAPSGSSKTKARREKEAADKRRRLSQAAVRAVVEAGGTLEGLERAGLIV